MEYKKPAGYLIVLAAILLAQSCTDELDLSGLIYSPDNANERYEESGEWNLHNPKQEIVVASDNYTFLVAGDPHVGHTKNLDHFIKKATAPEISFFILAGDLTTGQSYDYDTLYKHLTGLALLPYFLTVGNHDLFFDGWKSYHDYFGSATYTFTVESLSGRDLYICIDTGTGTLGSKQMQWLKETLKNTRNNYRNCIIITHVNFFREHRTASTNLLVEELYTLLDLFADNRVDVVIMGHDHRRSVEIFGQTHYITLDALEDEFDDASYLSVTNKKGTVSYKFIDVD